MNVPDDPRGVLGLIKEVDAAVTASASSAAKNDSCSRTGGYITMDVLLDSIRKEMKRPKAFSIRREDQLLPCAT